MSRPAARMGAAAPSPSSSSPSSRRGRHQTLSVLVENRSGVLARVSSLFARRGYNIISLAVAPTDDPGMSRITIVIDLEVHSAEQITKQLFKLVNVVKITELDPDESVERELLLASVSVAGATRSEVIELVGLFGGHIEDVGRDGLTVMAAGDPAKLDDLEDLLRPYGITDLQRTGRVALPRLERQAPRLRPMTTPGRAS